MLELQTAVAPTLFLWEAPYEVKMKLFLFYVNAIVGLDEWTDRKLIFPVTQLADSGDKLSLQVDTDDLNNFRKLNPSKSYALQFEYEDGSKELKYYHLRAFEIIPPPRDSTLFEIVLHVERIK